MITTVAATIMKVESDSFICPTTNRFDVIGNVIRKIIHREVHGSENKCGNNHNGYGYFHERA